MINFKQIELSDKKTIDECFAGNTCFSSDFCFTNLYAWNIKFKTEFAIIDKTLFLRFVDTDGGTYYTFPFGKMVLAKAFDLLIEDARAHNRSFQMKGIPWRMWEEIQAKVSHQFCYTHDRANDEYIYLSEKLISLSGKKLQSKRNHINRFKADNPDWEYIQLSSEEELHECLAMLKEWEENNGIDTDPSLYYDYLATQIMLKNFDYLGLRGGAIKVNNQIVAFSVGEALTDETFVVHVEKAHSQMNGAYTIINQQFVEHAASEFKYINREEDMGIENLRRAKESYYPEILLKEGIIRLT